MLIAVAVIKEFILYSVTKIFLQVKISNRTDFFFCYFGLKYSPDQCDYKQIACSLPNCFTSLLNSGPTEVAKKTIIFTQDLTTAAV